jgi:CRISPR-associated protein Cmr6
MENSPHCGLVYERFPRVLSRGADRWGIEGDARLKWLERFQTLARETPARAERLAQVHARLNVILDAGSGLTREAATVGRFVSGLGNASATDVGLSFDFACGVPFLAGSSVKGLARAGAKLAEARGDDILRLLGNDPEAEQPSSGAVAFLDALPRRWPRLEIDVITRHHDPDALPTQKTPLDADKPNPVHFITVAPETTFVFRLVPLRDSGPKGLETAWTWLAKALDELGAGAKTAVGYGWMSPVAP